jgi:tetraacyldisaccharide 4'-kinase
MKIQKFISTHLLKKTLISHILYPLSLINFLVQTTHRKFYGFFPNKVYKSNKFIISIGNIVSGGTGKTPLTILLSEILTSLNFKVAVSHRGYKGKFENTNKIISDYHNIYPEAKEAGDEANLLATKLKGIPIVVGKNRKKSIKLLESKFSDLDIIILDDSFQHLKVFHNLDLIVFNSISKIGNGFLLPAGILREPLNTIRNADLIVINGTQQIVELTKFQKPFIYSKYRIDKYYKPNLEPVSINTLLTSKIILLSGIGIPESFENTIKSENIQFVKHFIFEDHHQFTEQDLYAIQFYIKHNNIDYVLTTEKDFSKLQYLKNIIPLIIVSAKFDIINIEKFRKFICDKFDDLKN